MILLVIPLNLPVLYKHATKDISVNQYIGCLELASFLCSLLVLEDITKVQVQVSKVRITLALNILYKYKLIISFILGELYDALLSYDPGFYLSGVTIALSGLMLFSIPPIQRWQKKKANQATVNI